MVLNRKFSEKQMLRLQLPEHGPIHEAFAIAQINEASPEFDAVYGGQTYVRLKTSATSVAQGPVFAVALDAKAISTR